MPLYEPAMANFSEVVSYWLPIEIWANQQDSIGWYDGLAQIRRQAIIWINNCNSTCNTHSCRTWDNFMTMRPATIWRRTCWANYRTQYCRIFMKFTGTDGNINTALSATYQNITLTGLILEISYGFLTHHNTTYQLRNLFGVYCIWDVIIIQVLSLELGEYLW